MRVSVLRTTVPFRHTVALSVVVKVGLCFWCFFVSLGWDVGGFRGVSLDACRWLFGFIGATI